MKPVSLFSILAIVIALAIFAWGALFVRSQSKSTSGLYPGSSITNFVDCAAAGYPIMESYPRQCRTPEGVTFVEETDRTKETEETKEYYGSATGGPCQADADCQVAGCNQEICQSSAEEEMFSICILPDQPTPGDLGLACACVESTCQWTQP